MSALKNLLYEFHRRSLWQVLGIFLAASWGVLQVVQAVTESIGLPDWTPGMAFVLLLVGLPVVLATAFVQQGMPGSERAGASGHEREAGPDGAGGARAPDSAANLAPGTGSLDRPNTRPSTTRRLLTWRHAIVGGVGAFALLGFSLVAYFVMWETGIGPVGNLEAQGIFEQGEAVVLADFRNRSSDPTLGSVVTEALRVDLASSQAITLVSGSRVSEILDLMQRGDETGLPADVAREVAIRAGIKAVVDGEVGSAGSGYILTAAIRSVESGEPLATFRRTAASPDEVITAIDGLSQDIRERAGESLRSIKSMGSLEQFTTSSLEALRLFSESEDLSEAGEDEAAKAVLLEALELDPDFAMAWRKLGVVLSTASAEPGEKEAAATRAYDLRERLTPRERGLAAAYYHDVVTGDVAAGMRAYEDVLRDYPDDAAALNNLANSFAARGQYEEALEHLNRAIDGPGRSGPAFVNKVFDLTAIGRFEEAAAAHAEMMTVYPDRAQWNLFAGAWVEALRRDFDAALEQATALETLPGATPGWHDTGSILRLIVVGEQGRMDEAERGLREVVERRRGSGEALDHAYAAWTLALWLHSARGDDSGARVALEDAVGTAFPTIPPLARDYLGFVTAFVMVGDAESAATLLLEWEDAVGPSARPVISEMSVVVESVASADLDGRIDGVRRYQALTQCSRCYAWELAGWLEEAGRIEEAVEQVHVARGGLADGELFIILGPNRAFGLERLGRLYDQLGDAEQAVEYYRAFGALFPEADPDLAARKRFAIGRADELAAELAGR
jgi:eukaryotic-like serine/threonine-protein kinase